MLELMGPLYVLTRADSSAPTASDTNALSSLCYMYEQAKVQAAGRGILGFKALTTLDLQTGVATTTTYRQDFPYIGHPLKTEVKTKDGHLLRDATNTWRLKGYRSGWNVAGPTVGLGALQPYLARAVERTYDLPTSRTENGRTTTTAGARLTTVTTDTAVDHYGNPTGITVTTDDHANGKRFEQVTTNTYGTTSDTWSKRLGRLTRAVVRQRRDEGGDGVYETTGTRAATFVYYRAGNRAGLLRTETRQPGNAGLRHTTEYDYDGFGNRVRAAETAGGLTRCDTDTVEYDRYGRFVVLERDCLGRPLRRTSAYNAHGLPVRSERVLGVGRDGNDAYTITATRATDYYYTAGGRRYFTHADDGSHTGVLRASCAGVSHCPAGAAYYLETRQAGGGRQWAYRDVLERGVRARVAGFNYGLWVDTDTDYDALGRVVRRSEPYYPGDPVYRTVHRYDLLGRVVRTTLPDYDADADTRVNSVITVAYAGLTTTTTNGKGQSQVETRNALGEVIKSTDAAGTPVVHTYDAWGQVVRTTTGTGAKAVSVTWGYDGRGRRIKETDPDRGTWTYAYNGFDELIRQTDAVGNVQAMTYDALGRRISRRDTAPDGADADALPEVESDVTWTYDPAHGLGQPGTVRDTRTGYARTHRYDTLGRASVTATTVRVGATVGSEATWYSRQTWDEYGRAHQFFDAARQSEDWTDDAVEVQYNAWGYAHRWVDAVYEGGAPRRVYRTVTFRDVRGKATEEVLGGGAVRMARAYDARTGRVTSVTGRGAGHARLQTLSYEWDLLGNLGKRSETSIGKALEETFSYDTLNRLVRAQVVGRATQAVRYDALGNITSKTGTGEYTYGSMAAATPGPHAVTRAGGLTYAYDANGNVLTETRAGESSPVRTFNYTAANQVRRITRDMHTTAFVYGPDRSRIKRTDTVRTGSATSTTTTVYLGRVEQVLAADGSYTYKRTLTDGVLITRAHDTQGKRSGEETRYLLYDHLGSVDVITDAAGRVEQDFSFDAWGRRRAPDDWTVLALLELQASGHSRIVRHGFTGHEMLDAVGVIHMNGRIYDPTPGRFLQADPVIQFPDYSQGQNRYSYVLNNPLTYTDPTGYFIGKLFKQVFRGLNRALGDVSPFLGIALLGLPGVQGWVFASWQHAFAFGFATGGVASGSYKGALFGGISGAAFYGTGEYFTALTGLPGGGVGHVLTHGLAGGILAELRGGQFGHGFLAAGLSKAVMGRFNYHDGSTPAVLSRTAIAAIVGGTLSRITGGKFANGALTAAMAQLFNNEASARNRQNGVDYSDCGDGKECVVSNQGVRDELNRLNDQLAVDGLGHVSVSGGDSRYDPETGQSISKSVGEVIHGRPEGSFHNQGQNHRAVDIRGKMINITRPDLDRYIESHTYFKVFERVYSDGHIHMRCDSRACIND